MRTDGYVEVAEGLSEGESVVVRANFLIDAESNLKAALGSFGEHSSHGVAKPDLVETTPPATGHEGH
jgi:Cu(I)/Ag(I) efflux system membrane fusion protein